MRVRVDTSGADRNYTRNVIVHSCFAIFFDIERDVTYYNVWSIYLHCIYITYDKKTYLYGIIWNIIWM